MEATGLKRYCEAGGPAQNSELTTENSRTAQPYLQAAISRRSPCLVQPFAIYGDVFSPLTRLKKRHLNCERQYLVCYVHESRFSV